MDAKGKKERFESIKQLFDIGHQKLKNHNNPNAFLDFTEAKQGIVCQIPGKSEDVPEILFKCNSDESAIPASTIKMVNLLTAMDHIGDLDEKIILSKSDLQSGSGNFFYQNDILSVGSLLYGMMLSSSNTCAMAIAHHVGKKILRNGHDDGKACIDAFIHAMNQKVLSLGCQHSFFDSPSGLSKTSYTTSSDLLKILVRLSASPMVNCIWQTKNKRIFVDGPKSRHILLKTTVDDSLLSPNYDVLGGKTGSFSDNEISAESLAMIVAIKERQ